MIQFKYKSDFMVIVGNKGQGKTEVTKSFVRQIPAFVFIDPKFQVGSIGYCVHFPTRIVPAFLEWKRIVYQPAKGQDTLEAMTTAFNECLKISNYTLVIDEIDEYANSYGYMCDAVRELIRRGRLQGIGLIGNTRRPHIIHKDIRANADHVITFKMHELDDLKYMGKWLNRDENEIRNLEDHHSLYLDTHTFQVTHLDPLNL